MISGSQGFGTLGSVTVNTGDIQSGTMFTVTPLSTNLDQTMDYIGQPGGSAGAATYTTPASFTFTIAGFGTFMGSSLLSDVNSPATFSRNFDILGTFTPAFGGFGPTLGDFALSFTQVGGAGHALRSRVR